MNVDGPATPALMQRFPVYDPIWSSFERGDEDEAPQTAPVAGSLAAIEKQFAGLVRDLTRQLASLEKQLTQALKQLGDTKPTQNNDPNECDETKREHRLPMQRYGKIISDAARRHEVDPLLVGAVIRRESGFQPAVVSKAGAMGLMQLMPDTAKALGVSNAFDPQQNVEAGTLLLRQLLDRYNGHVDLALAAYNAGPAAVDKYGGIPPFAETQAYVRDIMEEYRESALSA